MIRPDGHSLAAKPSAYDDAGHDPGTDWGGIGAAAELHSYMAAVGVLPCRRIGNVWAGFPQSPVPRTCFSNNDGRARMHDELGGMGSRVVHYRCHHHCCYQRLRSAKEAQGDTHSPGEGGGQADGGTPETGRIAHGFVLPDGDTFEVPIPEVRHGNWVELEWQKWLSIKAPSSRSGVCTLKSGINWHAAVVPFFEPFLMSPGLERVICNQTAEEARVVDRGRRCRGKRRGLVIGIGSFGDQSIYFVGSSFMQLMKSVRAAQELWHRSRVNGSTRGSEKHGTFNKNTAQ